ncbi:MAG: alpha-glucan family phosphorylase [Candidatus Delongbacteria bacterium]
MNLRDTLLDLASDLLWSWKPWYREFLAGLDPAAFQRHENPVRLVRELPDERLKALEKDKSFQAALKELAARREAEHAKARARCPEGLRGRQVAYFSAEFGIHNSLPIYSGGLGVLSGDHIKSAHDLGLPFTGIGLMYRQGYFGQRIDAAGVQHADMELMNLEHLPMRRTVGPDDRPLEIGVDLPGRELRLLVWEVQVGIARLLLLDSDCERNAPADRGLTWQLYGGDRDTRLAQEIILGIGGVRALRALGVQPDVWHMNEGHSAFLAVERLREHLAAGLDFDTAVEATASSTIFTTHTPVPAGNEAFLLPRLHRYFHEFCSKGGIDFHRLLELGTETDATGYKIFSLTALAVRLSRFANGVSMLHGDVSRQMWYHLWHQVPIDETPIGHVTNGIHTASWVAPGFRRLYEERLGGDWEEKLLQPEAWEALRAVPTGEVWQRHQDLKAALVEEIRRNLTQRLSQPGLPLERVLQRIDPHSLFICFARRFATYKRAVLIFDDLERLDRIVNHPSHPVTLIFAGKAHPADHPGQALIRRVHEISLLERFQGRVILLEGYSLALARFLVQGADVWLNNPRRPLEASGTSGQKVCPNGGLNLSILDGWWVEGSNGSNGWNIGRDVDYGDEKIQDYYDVRSLYELLEERVVPLFYERDSQGLPVGWVDRMKDSLISCTARFSTSRMVNDYVVQSYIPAASKHQRARENDWQAVRDFVQYKRSLLKRWYHMTDTWLRARRENECVDVDAGLYLGLLKPSEVKVELFMRENGKIRTVEIPLVGPGEDDGVWNYHLYFCDPTLRKSELKLRVLPRHAWLDGDMEMGMCYWFHQKVE